MLSLLFDSTLQLEPTAVSRRTVHFILLTIVLIAAGLAGTRMTATEPEPIRIDAGLISGVSGEHDAGVRVFKGVPFAAPPLGPLRWRQIGFRLFARNRRGPPISHWLERCRRDDELPIRHPRVIAHCDLTPESDHHSSGNSGLLDQVIRIM
jgi:hypothetical protein